MDRFNANRYTPPASFPVPCNPSPQTGSFRVHRFVLAVCIRPFLATPRKSAWTNTAQTAACGAGLVGDPVTIAAGTYTSNISQDDADAQALTAAYAGLVCYWVNVEQTAECSNGSIGSAVTIAAGEYTSLVSQADANAQALAAAYEGLVCLWYNVEQSVSCPACSVGDAVVIAAASYSSAISQADADAQALAAAEETLVCVEPEAEFTLFIAGREAAFSLDGYDTYVASTPPRYFRTKTFSGTAWHCFWEGGGCGPGNVDNGGFAWDFSGPPLAWPDLTQDGPTYFRRWFSDTCGAKESILDQDQFFLSVPDLQDSGLLADGSFLVEETATFRRCYGTEACNIPPPGSPEDNEIGHGEIREDLTDEHTPCAALLDAVDALSWGVAAAYSQAQAVGGTVNASTGATWKADELNPRDWEGRQEQWTLNISSLLVGCPYTIRWYQDNAWQEESFVAGATTEQFSRVVPCGSSVAAWQVVRGGGSASTTLVVASGETYTVAGGVTVDDYSTVKINSGGTLAINSGGTLTLLA